MKTRPISWLPPITVRIRLLASLLGIAALLAGPAIYSIGRLQAVRDIAFELHDRHAASRAAVGELRAALAEGNRLQRSYIVTRDSITRTRMFTAMADARASYRRSEAPQYGVSSLPLGLTLNALDEATYRIDELVDAGAAAEATDYFGEVRHLYADAEVEIAAMANAIDQQSAQATIRAETIASAAATSTPGFAGLELYIDPLRLIEQSLASVYSLTQSQSKLCEKTFSDFVSKARTAGGILRINATPASSCVALSRSMVFPSQLPFNPVNSHRSSKT